MCPEENKGLYVSLLNKWRGRFPRWERDEFANQLWISFVNACRKFDPSKSSFGSWAYSKCWYDTISEYMRENGFKYRKGEGYMPPPEAMPINEDCDAAIRMEPPTDWFWHELRSRLSDDQFDIAVALGNGERVKDMVESGRTTVYYWRLAKKRIEEVLRELEEVE